MSTQDYFQHIINKPEKIEHVNQYSNIITIDSRDRNKFIFKNSNEFVIEIENTLNDIIEVELMVMYYSYSRYLFDSLNNKLYFKKDSNNYEYTIENPKGDYNTITTPKLTDKFPSVYANTKKLYSSELDFDITMHFDIT